MCLNTSLSDALLSGPLMLAKKTVKAKILELRKGKKQLLEEEYQNYQRYLRGDRDGIKLYSATKQQADRFLMRLRRQNGGLLDTTRDYPLILRNDTYDIRKEDTKLTPYWIRIPITGKRGGINCPIALSSEIPEGAKTREAKIIRKGEEWYVYITIEKVVQERRTDSLLAVDMGIRNIATTVNSKDPKPKFYGKELRQIRGHFYNLRKALQKKKAYGAVKKIGNRERKVVDSILHTISRRIVDEADKKNSTIVLGDLKGIRANRGDRSFNRRLNSFPFYRLAKFIEYKASWLGIPVIKVNEAHTSQRCHNCGMRGLRVGGCFKCNSCDHEYNADYNGAYNILKRAMGYISMAGAALAQPVTR
jgi:putative transposase